MTRPIPQRSLKLNLLLISVASATNLFFGSLKLINLSNITFYHYSSPRIINITIFSPSIDLWIWSVSLLFILTETLLTKMLGSLSFPRWTVLPCFFSLASLPMLFINERIASFMTVPLAFAVVGLSIYYGNGYLAATREEAASLTLLCVTCMLLVLEATSLSSWTMNIIDYEPPFSHTLRWKFPLIDLQLFNVLYPLTSWLLLIFLYSWLWIPASRYALSRTTAPKSRLPRIGRNIFSPIQNPDTEPKTNRKLLTACLILSLAAAAFIAYYPNISSQNSTLIGTDSTDYYDWLQGMMQNGSSIALNTDRPLANVALYCVQYVTAAPPEDVVRIMPVLCAVGLSLVVFWFVKTGTKDESLALMSSVLSSFSFQTVFSVFAYLFANWLAIIEVFVLLVFFLKSLEKHSWKHMLVATLIGTALLLTHLYTWDVLVVMLTAYLMWALMKRKHESKFEIAAPALLLVANLAFYAAYVLMPFGKGVSQGEGAVFSNSTIGITNFFNLPDGLASIVQKWGEGLFADPLMVILAIAGTFSLFNFAGRFNRIMLLWIMIPSLAMLAVTPDPNYYRLLYLIPLQIQAAAGLQWLLKKPEDMKASLKTNETFQTFKTSAIILVILFLLNYALRSVDVAPIHIV